MTTPVVTPIKPLHNKTWLVTAATVTGLIVSALTWVAPVLPEKFSVVALVVLAALQPVSAYLAKYKEPDEVIVKKSEVVVAGEIPPSATYQPPPPSSPSGPFKSKDFPNPYEQQ